MTQRTPSLSQQVPVGKPTTVSVPVPSSDGPHDLECLIQRTLQARPGLKFARLTVHKCPQGVCLEGLLEANDEGLDLCELVNEIAGVKAINHVVMRPLLSH